MTILGTEEEEETKREIEQYKNNPITKTINLLVNENGGLLRITATELQNEIANRTGNFVNVFTSSTLSKEIKKLQRYLLEIDKICYTPPPPNGSNGKRLHTFRKTDFTLI